MMRTLLLTLLLLCHFPGQLAAQGLQQLLDDHFHSAALEKLKEAKTLYFSGKTYFAASEIESTFKIYESRPDRIRVEGTSNGVVRIQAYDGETGWSLTPSREGGEPSRLTSQELENLLKQVQFENLLNSHMEKGGSVVLSETGDPGGNHHLVITPDEGTRQHIYLDRESNLLTRIVFNKTIGDTEMEIEVEYEGYKRVSGIPFAHSVITKMNGEIVTTTLYQKIEVNRKMDQDFFKIPVTKK